MAVKLISKFKDNLVSFFDELISQFPSEGEFIVIRVLIKDQLPIVEIINHFNTEILPQRDIIKNRNEIFFTSESSSLFSKLSPKTASRFAELWKNGSLDEDDKKVMWRWVDSFVTYIDAINSSKMML
jgi:hypothetical protein